MGKHFLSLPFNLLSYLELEPYDNKSKLICCIKLLVAKRSNAHYFHVEKSVSFDSIVYIQGWIKKFK